jgi:integrase
MHTVFTAAAANDPVLRTQARERTVPIPATITPVPGYPRKLSVFKIAASKFWQVRCWIAGRTHRRSTQTQSLRMAQSFARDFYEQLLAQSASLRIEPTESSVVSHVTATVKPQLTFAAMAAQMLTNEHARVERGEFSSGSLKVLRNRLDAHILPRWGKLAPSAVDHAQLLAFTQYLSKSFSTITVSQYLVAVRKILTLAVAVGALDKLPEFPKVRVQTNSRGAFTPTEYWRIMRTARKLQYTRHPDSELMLRKNYRLRTPECTMPPDVAWVIGFMVNSFIRPSDLKTLKHRHVEVVRNDNTYLRLTLPETKSHGRPIVTLQPAVRIYQQLTKHYNSKNLAGPDNYLFLPHLRDRAYAHCVLAFHFNWILARTGLKLGAHGQERSLYSLRHSSITFRLLYGQGIDLLTLARNARTSVDMINQHYASTVTAEQNIGMLQSRRTRQQNQSVTS